MILRSELFLRLERVQYLTPTYLSHWQPQPDRDLDPLTHTLPSLNPTFFSA